MNPIEKAILDAVVKPPVTALLAELTANQTANVAAIEATIGNTGTNALTAVVGFLMSKIKSTNPFVTMLETLALPTLSLDLTVALGTASAGVPALYAKALAFLTREIGFI